MYREGTAQRAATIDKNRKNTTPQGSSTDGEQPRHRPGSIYTSLRKENITTAAQSRTLHPPPPNPNKHGVIHSKIKEPSEINRLTLYLKEVIDRDFRCTGTLL